jgi:chromosome segregation ATPase
VWRQLDDLCDRSPLVAPLRLQRLRHEKQQLQQIKDQLIKRSEQLGEDKQQLQAGFDKQQQINSELMERNARLSSEVAELHRAM